MNRGSAERNEIAEEMEPKSFKKCESQESAQERGPGRAAGGTAMYAVSGEAVRPEDGFDAVLRGAGTVVHQREGGEDHLPRAVEFEGVRAEAAMEAAWWLW